MYGTAHLYSYTVIEKLKYLKSKKSRKIQQHVKGIRAVEEFQVLLLWKNFVRAYQNGVDEVCAISSSKDFVQPLFHPESLYGKQPLTLLKSRKVSSVTLPLCLMYFQKI